jgi:PAS domain S-box-containing protein
MADIATANVAVVDDNPATLYSTSRILHAANFNVSEGINGEQALELAFKGIDILLLDANLPDIHGFDVCKQLRGDPRTARLPVIHVSATFVKEVDKAQGLDSGGDGYLTHPIEPPVLIATVNAFLRARRAEEQMRNSEAKFKAVFENALRGILLLDQHLNYLEVNPAMCEMLGRSREEIVGQPLSRVMLSETSPDLQEIERALQADGAWRGVFPLLRSNGEPVHLEWYISAHKFPGVRLAVVTDMTERLLLEAERNDLLASERRARAEAERASRLKDEFLGTLSHELRTPLNTILLWTQMLQQRSNDRVLLQRGLATIERNTKAQAQLISDLLDVSRISAGKLRLDIQPLDLVAIVKSVLEGLSPAIDAKQLKLQIWFDTSAGIIFGDPARLQQVVWNLVNNAIKFTPNGGRIEVRLERAESHLELKISDTGQGITAELLPYLFERFRQGDVSANRTHGGLGIGLAIVKHLVEMHGGVASASSPGPGKGATFTVRLPVQASLDNSLYAAANPNGGHTGEIARLEGVRVLFVDDDADACAAISSILNETGAVVKTALSVNAALDIIEQFKPQVLISDIGMPEQDGFELIRGVRARGYSYRMVPAIALTALARPEDRRRALLAGYQVHLAKPIDGGELSATVAALIGHTASNK